MEKKEIAIILGVLAIVIAAIVLFSTPSDNFRIIHINEDLIETDHFDLTTEEGSTANGTILYIDEGEDLRAVIVADLHIVSDTYYMGLYIDMVGGIIPETFYSEYNLGTPGVSHVYRSSDKDEDGYPESYTIWVDRHAIGGSGVIVIDCAIKPTFERGVDTLKFVIQLGSVSEHITQTL